MGHVHCQDCDLSTLCIPLGLDDKEIGYLDSIIRRNRKVKKKSILFHAGEPCHSLYAVRSGSVKTIVVTADGDEMVTGFFLPGELFGLEGLANGEYQCTAVALEDSGFCQLPLRHLDRLVGEMTPLRNRLMGLMGKQISENQSMMVLLGSRHAEERLASFLLGLILRYRRYNDIHDEIELSMPREDIANYLGLTTETVSRLMTRFREEGVVDYRGRRLFIRDVAALRERVSLCNGKYSDRSTISSIKEKPIPEK
ncbi:MAG: fumarate/nitrate reduction transcriptional regulator Fnr [Gammaproteobacteria bacterium]|nr:MAG: fumarate/nitrate reduction transcriptional regulator Fnr [Gammaproteobacteria bacterium]